MRGDLRSGFWRFAAARIGQVQLLRSYGTCCGRDVQSVYDKRCGDRIGATVRSGAGFGRIFVCSELHLRDATSGDCYFAVREGP